MSLQHSSYRKDLINEKLLKKAYYNFEKILLIKSNQ